MGVVIDGRQQAFFFLSRAVAQRRVEALSTTLSYVLQSPYYRPFFGNISQHWFRAMTWSWCQAQSALEQIQSRSKTILFPGLGSWLGFDLGLGNGNDGIGLDKILGIWWGKFFFSGRGWSVYGKESWNSKTRCATLSIPLYASTVCPHSLLASIF